MKYTGGFSIYPQYTDKSSQNSKTVVNLSSKPLSDEAVSVRSRGLNFAPVPRKIPIEDIITSIENTVVGNRIPHYDAECLRQDVSKLLRKLYPPESNITPQEMVAIRNLRNDNDVFVLPADKECNGGCGYRSS